MLATKIYSHNSTINLKGVAIGNGLLLNYQGQPDLTQSKYDYFLAHGLITTDAYEKKIESCCECTAGAVQHQCDFLRPANKTKCESVQVDTMKMNNPFNIYDDCPMDKDSLDMFDTYIRPEFLRIGINYKLNTNNGVSAPVPGCVTYGTATYLNTEAVRTALHLNTNNGVSAPVPGCVTYGTATYLNTEAVRTALHVRPGSKKWSMGGGPYDWQHFKTPQVETVKQLINTYKIPKLIVYNGDFDTVCNFIGDQRFVSSLGFQAVGHYREWTVDGTSDGVIGGFIQNYEKGLSFVVVRGAGHMVPNSKPDAGLQLLKGLLGFLQQYMADTDVKNGGRKYVIPPVRTNFAHHMCPLVSDTGKMAQYQQWWFEYSLHPRHHFDRRIGSSMIGCASLFYPHCKSAQRFENVVKWVGHLFVWDDHNDAAVGQLSHQSSLADPIFEQLRRAVNRLEGLYMRGDCGREPMTAWRPYVMATYAVVDAILADLNAAQRRRVIDGWRRYIDGQQLENKMIDRQMGNTVEEIQKIRMTSGSAETMFAIIEYSDGVSVTDTEWADPRMSRLRELSNLSIQYVNDVYSFEKELHEKNGQIERMFVNLVAHYVLREGLTVGQAMEKTLHACREVETEFESLSRQVHESADFSPDAKHYVRSLAAMIGGNHHMSATITRYNNIY
ncbi:unnamed protein product, partial [Medioppia subpectinata]